MDHETKSQAQYQEAQHLKTQLRIISGKFSKMKREKQALKKVNLQLQEQVVQLQQSQRQMIPGFCDTGGDFPMPHELAERVSEFKRYECEDAFFDLLSPELNMKGIIFFYYTAFKRTKELIEFYFQQTEKLIMDTGCMDTLEGPVMNVLRKSYQGKWKKMQAKAIQERSLNKIVGEIQKALNLGNSSEETTNEVKKFIRSLAEMQFQFYISDPVIHSDYKKIGTKIHFSPIKHEPLDGFMKPQEECYILLPPIIKGSTGVEISRPFVLSEKYEFVC